MYWKMYGTISDTAASPSSERSIFTSKREKSEATWVSPATNESTQLRLLRSERSEPSDSWPSRCER